MGTGLSSRRGSARYGVADGELRASGWCMASRRRRRHSPAGYASRDTTCKCQQRERVRACELDSFRPNSQAIKPASSQRSLHKQLRSLLRFSWYAVVVIFAIWAVALGAVITWASRDRAKASDAIVVLGAAQYWGKPSPVL